MRAWPIVSTRTRMQLSFQAQPAKVQWPNLIKRTMKLLAQGNFIEPIVFGDKFDMHEVTVLAGLTLWSVLWGIPGECTPPCSSIHCLPHLLLRATICS